MKRAVIFDFMRTLYDPLTASLYSGVKEMLDDVHESRCLVLYSRQDRSRAGLLKDLGIDECFEATYFSAHKSAEELRDILHTNELEPKHTIVVGDMVNSELCAGSEIGCDTIWFKSGMFDGMSGDVMCVPTHTISSIPALHELLRKLP